MCSSFYFSNFSDNCLNSILRWLQTRIYFLYRVPKKNWNKGCCLNSILRWLHTRSYFLYRVTEKKLEQRLLSEFYFEMASYTKLFSVSCTEKKLEQRLLLEWKTKIQKYLLWTWAKFFYRSTDFSTVGLRQTNNFLRTA